MFSKKVLTCALLLVFLAVTLPSNAEAGWLKELLKAEAINTVKDKAKEVYNDVSEAVSDGVEWVADTFGMDSGSNDTQSWCSVCGEPVTTYFNSGSDHDACID